MVLFSVCAYGAVKLQRNPKNVDVRLVVVQTETIESYYPGKHGQPVT